MPMRTERRNAVSGSAVLVHGALALMAALVFVVPARASAQSSASLRESLERELAQLESEAAKLDQTIAETQSEAKTLERQVKLFESEIKRRELEIRRLALAIRQAEIDIQLKVASVEELAARIGKNRTILARNVARLYEYDQENMLVVLAKNETLSDFFTALDNVRSLQAQIGELVGELKGTKEQVEREKEELEGFRESQLALKALGEVERRAAQEKRVEKDRLLKVTRGREAEFQKLLVQKKSDIAALKTQLFYLERTGISAADALKFAELAARRTGIRTAFLLALLEVETGRQFEGGVISAGTHLGTGNWREDMYNCYLNLGRRSAAEAQKNAFFEITSKLGLNPDKMPVSRRPSYGCGGAMGPAQFIPTTWLLFESKTASLTGHRPPNPWNIEDAFTASAIFLAEAGASSQTRAGELQAARTYISGRPSCPASGSARYACLAYANRVASLAEDIDRVI
ncbi:MAG: hypothetical protein A3B37_01910 [Candidatus Sungbacteria bacterium RIFCSPLOWO2_01_FULL_59_16]|uniref:Transglycosylase SLT domain-containing protein n=1 Tax=Candidatus Sungbacteria bacterium RIFCSPLOWO2_01_FULL_59_16 TaxID=1802280 RepID=A0A1G2LAM4_9BACT|nr:MAG: hypothetical protein A3B37_01910 [Candidatus Sungbacteria bacterium RIFCSPLOWO2_01_FULL_59_16]